MRPAFDFVDKDSVLEDGGKARKKEPGTPNGCMAEQPAYLNFKSLYCWISLLQQLSLSIYQHTRDITFHKEKGSMVK